MFLPDIIKRNNSLPQDVVVLVVTITVGLYYR